MGQGGAGLPGASRGPADDINSTLKQPLGGQEVSVISGHRADEAHEAPGAAEGLSWCRERPGTSNAVMYGELTVRDTIRGSHTPLADLYPSRNT